MKKFQLAIIIFYLLCVLILPVFAQKGTTTEVTLVAPNTKQPQTAISPIIDIAREEEPFAVLAYTTNTMLSPPIISTVHIAYLYPSGGMSTHTINLNPGEFVDELELAVDPTHQTIHLLAKIADTLTYSVVANTTLKYYRIPYNWPSVLIPLTIPTGFPGNIFKTDLTVDANEIGYLAIYHYGVTYWDPADLQLLQILPNGSINNTWPVYASPVTGFLSSQNFGAPDISLKLNNNEPCIVAEFPTSYNPSASEVDEFCIDVTTGNVTQQTVSVNTLSVEPFNVSGIETKLDFIPDIDLNNQSVVTYFDSSGIGGTPPAFFELAFGGNPPLYWTNSSDPYLDNVTMADISVIDGTTSSIKPLYMVAVTGGGTTAGGHNLDLRISYDGGQIWQGGTLYTTSQYIINVKMPEKIPLNTSNFMVAFVENPYPNGSQYGLGHTLKLFVNNSIGTIFSSTTEGVGQDIEIEFLH